MLELRAISRPGNSNALQDSLRTLKEYILELYNVDRFSASDVVVSGTATLETQDGSPVISFAAGSTTDYQSVLMSTRDLWSDGTLTVSILWSGDTADDSDVKWEVDILAKPLDGVEVSSGPVVITSAGPLTSHFDREDNVTGAELSITSAHQSYGVRFRRAGADDDYPGVAYMKALKVTYRSTRR